MARNGSGIYTLPANSWYPAVSGVSATYGDWNTTAADIQTALTGSVAADGQTLMTGDLNFNNTNHCKNMTAASATGHALVYGQASWSLAAGTLTGALTATSATLSSTLAVTGTTTLSGAVTSTAGGTVTTAAWTFVDSFLQIVGSADATKKVVFEVDGITTGTTRTVTVPDRNLTLQSIQTVTASTTAFQSGVTTIPFDDTIPQNTEGTDLGISCTITPVSATSKLVIQVDGVVSNNTSGSSTALVLIQNGTANALAASAATPGLNNYLMPISFTYSMTSGTTSAITFNLRAGASANTWSVNGSSGVRFFGGVMKTSITVTEIA